MKININCRSESGLSLIELILAMSIFMIIIGGAIGVLLQGINSNRSGNERIIALQYASEGMETVRSIKNQDFNNLDNNPSTGIARTGNVWTFSGSSNTFNTRFNRVLSISDTQRDCNSNNIITSGGYVDPNTKQVTSKVTWDFSTGRQNTVELKSYLTNWKSVIPSPGTLGGGMLVYGDGGTTSDDFKYKILDPTTGTWSTPGNIDFDTSASNKAVRSLRIYSSATRTEKIVISRHLAGSNAQSIWSHVWNGSGFASIQLSSWTSTAATDVRNFDGDYLSNGNFLVVYSDNTSIIKYRVWNGRCWSNQSNLVDLANNGSGVPNYITTDTRPGTNEVMVATLGTDQDVNTQYFNGTSWTLHPQHSNKGPANQETIDFVWRSPQNTLKGMLVFNQNASGQPSRQFNTTIFIADGLGSGSWSSTANTPNTGGTVGSLKNDGRKGAEEFIACGKNSSNDIYCYRSDTTPTWTTPTNNAITTSTDNGIQRSFDFAFEASTGTNGLNVYSDTTAIPKLKKFTSSTNTFDSSATNLNSVTTSLESVRLKPAPNNDDIMITLSNTSNRIYSVLWNGTSNAVYTTPTGKAFTAHQTSTNGSSDEDFYYDFAWDKY